MYTFLMIQIVYSFTEEKEKQMVRKDLYRNVHSHFVDSSPPPKKKKNGDISCVHELKMDKQRIVYSYRRVLFID